MSEADRTSGAVPKRAHEGSDQDIDRAVQRLVSATPSPAFSRRVMERLHERRTPSWPLLTWRPVLAAAATVLIAVALWTGLDRPAPISQPASHDTRTAPPADAQTPAPSAMPLQAQAPPATSPSVEARRRRDIAAREARGSKTRPGRPSHVRRLDIPVSRLAARAPAAAADIDTIGVNAIDTPRVDTLVADALPVDALPPEARPEVTPLDVAPLDVPAPVRLMPVVVEPIRIPELSIPPVTDPAARPTEAAPASGSRDKRPGKGTPSGL